MRRYKHIEEYGIIGNLDTCALIANDGSIDWCSFPHIESPSIFGAILDSERGGYFSLQPAERFTSYQAYRKKTNVLETIFETSSGVMTLTDFMPPLKEEHENRLHAHQIILRRVRCAKGKPTLRIEYAPRFNYARSRTVIRTVPGGISAEAQGEYLFLQAPFPLYVKNNAAYGTFPMGKGDDIWILLQYGHELPLSQRLCENLLKEALDYWREWAHNCEGESCVFGGPWHDMVERSGLVLKLLTHRETGAIAAAPTTSLPEVIGGERNWDYRFNWIRDAAFTIQALSSLGHKKEARKHIEWYKAICEEIEPAEIQIMYGLHGETDLREQELLHLSGYRNSRPVRIGNAAASQRQLDIYGELINALYETTAYGEGVSEKEWPFFRKIIDYVCEAWMLPDAGIWEVRGQPRHFTYSKLMCWVALDRGIRIARKKGFEAPFIKWDKTKREIRKSILLKGFNRRLKSFVQSFDSEILDATSLLIPLMGFLPFKDERVKGTIDATMNILMPESGFVYRYNGEDGLEGEEGAFILCSFWLVDALALSGRVEEAKTIFTKLLACASPLGLFAEEIDASSGIHLGNFPQAFSHIGLINSALYLGIAERKLDRKRGDAIL